MLMAALVVGLVTAWSYGPRAGMTAAGVALGLFILAVLFPALAVYSYIVVGVGVAYLAATAARKPRHPLTARAMDLGKLLVRRFRGGQ